MGVEDSDLKYRMLLAPGDLATVAEPEPGKFVLTSDGTITTVALKSTHIYFAGA